MISAKRAREIFGRKLKPEMKVSTPSFSKKMVFLPNYPEVFPYLNYDHCYVVVHPGFSSSWVDEEFRFAISQDGKDYPEYSSEIKKLIKYLGNSNELSIFFIEYERKYSDDFLPPENSLILFTKNGTHRPLKTIKVGGISKKEVEIEWDEIYSFLKNVGVKEVRMAGEWVWWDAGMGCVGCAAEKFEKSGFEVKGVENCLYPTFPPSKISKLSKRMIGRDIGKIVRKLYENQVKLKI
jgi:hypothetical protein